METKELIFPSVHLPGPLKAELEAARVEKLQGLEKYADHNHFLTIHLETFLKTEPNHLVGI